MPDYDLLSRQVAELAKEEPDFVPLLANVSALLYEALDQVNWAGFYLMDKGSLLLGPFQGKAACIRIMPGKGVCGAACKENRTIRVQDVHAFPGHIACDSASASEIVVPLHDAHGMVIGVLDIDSPVKNRFSGEDEEGLKKVAESIEALADFSRLRSGNID